MSALLAVLLAPAPLGQAVPVVRPIYFPTALYEVDLRERTCSLVVIGMGNDDTTVGSPEYGPGDRRLAFDATHGQEWADARVGYWDRESGQITPLAMANFASWTPDGATILAQNLMTDRRLVTLPVDQPGEKTAMDLKLSQPALSPDGRYLLTQEADDSPDGSTVRFGTFESIGTSTLEFPYLLRSKVKFAQRPADTLPDGRPILATIVLSAADVADPSPQPSWTGVKTGLFAADIVPVAKPADGANPDLSKLTTRPRLLLEDRDDFTLLSYPTGAYKTDAVAFRYWKADGRYRIGLMRQSKPDEFETIIDAPPEVYLAQLAMGRTGRYLAFKSPLFHLDPVDGQLLEAEDILVPTWADGGSLTD